MRVEEGGAGLKGHCYTESVVATRASVSDLGCSRFEERKRMKGAQRKLLKCPCQISNIIIPLTFFQGARKLLWINKIVIHQFAIKDRG